MAEKHKTEGVRPYCVIGGLVAGIAISLGYLWLNHLGRTVGGAPATPDPLTVRFGNVFLIIAAATFQGSLIGRVADLILRKKKGGS